MEVAAKKADQTTEKTLDTEIRDALKCTNDCDIDILDNDSDSITLVGSRGQQQPATFSPQEPNRDGPFPPQQQQYMTPC